MTTYYPPRPKRRPPQRDEDGTCRYCDDTGIDDDGRDCYCGTTPRRRERKQ